MFQRIAIATCIATTVLLGAAVPAASAAILAHYDPTVPTSNVSALASGPTAPGVTAGLFHAIAPGSGHVLGSNHAGFSAANDNIFMTRTQTTDSLSGPATPNAVDANDYFFFTVTPDVGKALNLTSLNFRHAGTRSNATSPFFTSNLVVRVSFDNFVTFTDVLTTSHEAVVDSGAGIGPFSSAGGVGNDHSIQFADFGDLFQGVTDPFEVRFYFYYSDLDASPGGGTNFHRLTEVTLHGEVVPEPSSCALGLLALGSVLAYAGRRRMTVGRRMNECSGA